VRFEAKAERLAKKGNQVRPLFSTGREGFNRKSARTATTKGTQRGREDRVADRNGPEKGRAPS